MHPNDLALVIFFPVHSGEHWKWTESTSSILPELRKPYRAILVAATKCLEGLRSQKLFQLRGAAAGREAGSQSLHDFGRVSQLSYRRTQAIIRVA